jgi:hypothetical protein
MGNSADQDHVVVSEHATRLSGPHDAACICLPRVSIAGMPGSAGECSRCLVPADGRRRPRRGTCMSLTTESLRPCLAERGIATLGDCSRQQCLDARATSRRRTRQINPRLHERRFSAILLSSLAHKQVSICRAFMQKCALQPWCSRRLFTTILTPRSHDVHPAGCNIYVARVGPRGATPDLRAGECLRGTHVAFSFPTYCIERPRASTCAPRYEGWYRS